MGLINKKIKDNKWLKTITKRVAGVSLAVGVGFGSFLGLSGCKSGDNVKNEPSGDNKNTEQVNNDFSSLEQVVENLKAIIQELDNDNSELNAKMLELEQKIIDAKVNGQNNADVINSINAIIKEMQAEIKSIKSKLDSLKNDEEIKNLNTRISKAEAMLAVENACNNYYLSMQVDKVVKIASPNGDIVCERGEYDDFGYYNKELDMVFCSDHGEESFAVGQFQEGSVAEMINYYFEKDDFFLNEEDSLDNRYVFLNEEGSSIVIDVQVGSMTSMSINLDDYNMNVARDSKANYDKLFHKCKQSLKSIELYQNFNDVFNASLNYKYVGVSSLLYDIYGKYEGSGVISGFNASSESTTPAGEKNYSLLGESNQYYLTIDEKNNQKLEESFDNSESPIRNFKFGVINYICSAHDNTIEYNEEFNRYTIISTNRYGRKCYIKFKFNGDLSVECNIIDIEKQTEVIYEFKEITKEKFDEEYNRVSSIIQIVLEKEDNKTL